MVKSQALALLENMKAEAVLADKGYDADYVVEAVGNMGAIVVIPPKSNRKILREYDVILYKERNHIERMFSKLKHFRRVATRYDGHQPGRGLHADVRGRVARGDGRYVGLLRSRR